MDSIIPILIAVITGGVFLLFLMLRGAIKPKKGKNHTLVNKNQNAVIRECNKKLTHDPHNISALSTLADIYYANQNWEKAFPLYDSLYNLSSVHIEIDPKKMALRQGICALKCDKIDEGMKGLVSAYHLAPDEFETNFYLGSAFYQKKDYDKAIACLKKAHISSPDASEVNAPLGFSFYMAKRYKESLPFLRHVLDENPENKEALFDLATAMDESGYGDKALKVFMHLRPDPKFGASSCIEAGKMHARLKQYEAAVQDYEIGLKLEAVPLDQQSQLRYYLAASYISLNNISRALLYLRQIQDTSPNYKDVPALLQRYQELNQNSNLQTYMLAGTSDFVALCRKFVTAYYADAFVKIEDISIATESIEMLCSVETSKWEDNELFRFYRNTGAIGELFVRDFHSKLRDIKCDRGFCVTAGTFTEEAHKYAEGRPVDLIEKTKLVSILKKIDILE
jgi:tetratricopeptide (TPR) repeat protein